MIHIGDCLDVLRTLPDESVQTCVTSPPYWGLRDYGVDGQLGLEKSPEEYVAKMVEVFREVRRLLKGDGTLWMNLGDSYAGCGGFSQTAPSNQNSRSGKRGERTYGVAMGIRPQGDIKPKDLVGIPWRVAFALQADGWYLRQDIIWHKPNPMPESVRDRCTKAHEYVFLMAKSARYYYDADAVREPVKPDKRDALWGKTATTSRIDHRHDIEMGMMQKSPPGFVRMSNPLGRNRRSVWTIAPKPFREAHFATYPPALVEPCILAGSRPGDTVLDPFNGAGTTGLVAAKLGREYIGIELNPEYAAMAERRIAAELAKTALLESVS